VIVIRSRQTSYTINNLQKWTLYRIKINVFNDKGDGRPSTTVVERTLEDGKRSLKNYYTTVM
jgi:hypothetical protein